MPTLQDDKSDERLSDNLDPAVRAEREMLERLGATPPIADGDRNTRRPDTNTDTPGLPSKDDTNDDPSAKGIPAAGLRGGEENPGSVVGSDTVGKGFTGKGKKRVGLRARVKKHRLALLIVATPLSGVIIFILLLILFASSLKLPDVMQHIESYEFANVTNQFRKNALRVTEEKLALESAPEGTAAEGATADNPKGVIGQLNDRFKNLKDGAFERINKYKPSNLMRTWGGNLSATKTAETWAADNGLELKYSVSNLTGRRTLISIKTNLGTYEIPPVSGAASWVPGVKQYVRAKNQTAALNALDDEVAGSIEAEGTGALGTVVRNGASIALRKAIGGSLAGWAVNKFSGKNPQAAVVEETVDTYKAGEAGTRVPDNATTEQISDGEEEIRQATAEELKDPKEISKIADQNFDSGAAAAAEKAVKSSLTSDVLNKVNVTYSVAVPLCMIYDGSIQKSQPSIDNQTAQQQRIFYDLASKADMQKDGTPISDTSGDGLATAIQATGTQLGDISKTNPEIRAGGGTVNTGDVPPSEGGSGGTFDFSLLNVLGLDPQSTAGEVVTYVVNNTCSALTNTYVGFGIAAINLGAIVVSGGSAEGIEQAAGETATHFIGRAIGQYVKTAGKNLVGKKIVTVSGKDALNKVVDRGLLNRATRFTLRNGLKLGAIVGATYGATEYASQITASRAGAYTNGLAQGADLINEAESGANIVANETERTQFFGRPLLVDEVCQAHQSALAYLTQEEGQKSIFDRYLSPSDADSLLSHTATSLSGGLNRSLPTSFANFVSSIFHPTVFFGSIYNMFVGKVSAAATCTSDTTDYGNLQFGWSNAENNLIDGDPSYQPLENQEALDQGLAKIGKTEGSIASIYALCFGYHYTGSTSDDTGVIFDPGDPNSSMQLDVTDSGGYDGVGAPDHASIGDLLASGYIMRDGDTGDVKDDDSTCSPKSLGINNSTYGNLVFRWRVAMAYDMTTDQLIDEQTVTDSDTPPASTTPTTTTNDAPTIVIDPGHAPTFTHTDAATDLDDSDYENEPEMKDVYEVAQIVQKKLTTDGYNVIMTKKSVDDQVSLGQRAAVANKANADLALSIHDQAGASGGVPFDSGNNIVYYQSVGDYRVAQDGKKITFTDSSVAATSKQYGQIFKDQRAAAQGTSVALQADVGYDLGTRGLSGGNIWMVQLLSKVPWIYNEAGGNSAGQVGLNGPDEQKYANGLISAVEKSVPIK